MLPPDKSTEIDSFGFEPYVNGIENLIRGATSADLPLAVGIYGPWGSGKSSFMKQLKTRLEAQDGNFASLPTIWFDAWKYDRIDDTRSALIYRIMIDMRNRSEGELKGKITNALKNASGLLLAFARGTRLKIGVPGIGLEFPTPEEITADAESFQTDVDEFSRIFADLVGEFLEGNPKWVGGKLIVFIDDLDRCLPENVITSLEGLKLFLDEAPCVFVLGLVRSIVEKAVQIHYGSPPGEMGRDYLDKIIQVPFVIPPVNPNKLIAHFRTTAEFDDESIWKIVELASHGNPRMYSRFIGSWNVVSALAPEVGLDLGDDPLRRMVAIALAVSLRFPRLHEMGMSTPEAFKHFYDRCQNREWNLLMRGDDSQSANEYHPYWEHLPTRSFFHDLGTELKGANPFDAPGPAVPILVATAFRLAAVSN